MLSKIISCLAILMWADSARAEQANSLLGKAQTLLAEIEEKLNERTGGEPSAVIEMGAPILSRIPQFEELQDQVQNWPEMVKNISTIAPTESSKAILFVSFQKLPADDYLLFLREAVQLETRGTISKKMLIWALFPPKNTLKGILERNYQVPLVIEIVQNLRKIYRGDPNMTKYCDNVLSGEGKKKFDQYLKDFSNKPSPVLIPTTNASASQNSAHPKSYETPAITPVGERNRPADFKTTFALIGLGIFLIGFTIFALRWRSRQF